MSKKSRPNKMNNENNDLPNSNKSKLYQKTKSELIEIACKMSQELRDICDDAIECGSALPGTEELLKEWDAKYKEFAQRGGV